MRGIDVLAHELGLEFDYLPVRITHAGRTEERSIFQNLELRSGTSKIDTEVLTGESGQSTDVFSTEISVSR